MGFDVAATMRGVKDEDEDESMAMGGGEVDGVHDWEDG